MRAWIAIAFFAALPALAAPLDLNGYQDADGAVRLRDGGDFIDPYFSLKSLLLAQRYGLEAQPALRSFIAWLLPRQRPDGSFDRYCRSRRGIWQACRRADADDALLALWLEALDSAAPAAGTPPAWRRSAALAEAALKRTRDGNDVYRIFADQPVALFMDNVEILDSQRRLAASARLRGNASAALHWGQRASLLERAVEKVFGNGLETPLRISTQTRREAGFYPDQVAQPFGWLHGYPLKPDFARWRAWFYGNGEAWQRYADSDAPWGIIALVALDAGDTDTACGWRMRQAAARGGGHWNILEEISYQAISARAGSACPGQEPRP